MQGDGGTTSSGSKRVLSEMELDRMVDAYFDRDLNINDRRRLFDQLSGKGGRCEDIARMQRILAQLRQPPAEIDIADEVIAQVANRRSFLSPAMRSAIRVGRMAVAASILLTLLGVVIVQRIAPDATGIINETTPVTSLMNNTGSELAQIRTSLEEVSERAAHVLLPQVNEIISRADHSVVVTVGIAQIDAPQIQPEPTLIMVPKPQLVVLSGAGDYSIGEIWDENDATGAMPQGFAPRSAPALTQRKTLENRAVALELTSRIDGKRTYPVPYYVEYFQAGSVPVSFDSEIVSGVLRLISRTSEAPKISRDHH